MEPSMLFYDGDCGFCRWSADRILRWDRHGRLRAAEIQGPEGDRLLGDLDPAARLASWHLVTPDGSRTSGAEAAAPLARLLPGGGPIAAVASALPGLTARLYRWVSRHRTQLGRIVGARACAVDPTARRPTGPRRPAGA